VPTSIEHTHRPPLNTHCCETAFLNTFGDLPFWIDPVTTIRIVTQNFQGINSLAYDDKLQNGTANMVALQAGIACLTEMNVEWRNYICRQGYKSAFTKIYSASRDRFSSSS
jgi:hypothetical protein